MFYFPPFLIIFLVLTNTLMHYGSFSYMVRGWFMQNGSQWHNYKGRAMSSLENIYLSIYLQGSKGMCGVLLWVGVGDRTELQYIDPHSYDHQRCVFLVLLMLNQRPGGSAFCWVLAFSTTSSHQRVSETTGGPEGPFGREWLSLPHLISNSLDPNCLTSCLDWVI